MRRSRAVASRREVKDDTKGRHLADTTALQEATSCCCCFCYCWTLKLQKHLVRCREQPLCPSHCEKWPISQKVSTKFGINAQVFFRLDCYPQRHNHLVCGRVQAKTFHQRYAPGAVQHMKNATVCMSTNPWLQSLDWT